MNFAKFLGTPSLRNNYKQLLLKLAMFVSCFYHGSCLYIVINVMRLPELIRCRVLLLIF